MSHSIWHLAAVGKNGWTLQFASENLKDNEIVVLAGIHKDGRALCTAYDNAMTRFFMFMLIVDPRAGVS